MVLSDGEIWDALESAEIEIEPLYQLDAVKPSSVDLRLADNLQVQRDRPVGGMALYPPDLDITDFLERFTEPCDISAHPHEMKPHQFVIGTTLERIRLPLHIAARVEGKSSLARLGVGVHITAPKIDPGYNNTITLEMFNFGPFNVQLRGGMEICTLILEHLGRPANQGYSGRFQGP